MMTMALASLTIGASCARNNPEASRVLDDLRARGLISDADYTGSSATADPSPARDLEAPNDPRVDALPADGPLDLAALFAAADRANPRLAAARAAVGEAGGRAWQAALAPNPTVELEVENARLKDGGLGDVETTIGVAQPIRSADRRRAAAAEGRSRMTAEEHAFDATRRAIHADILRALVEYAYADAAARRHENLLDFAGRTLELAEGRFERRAAPESDVIRARVESNELELGAEEQRGLGAASLARLETLLGGTTIDPTRLDLEFAHALAAFTPPALDEIKQDLSDEHPALQAARAQIEVAEATLELERERRADDPTIRAGLGYAHGDDDLFLEAGVGVPWPLYDRNQGAVLAARFAVIRARREADAVANELLGDLAASYELWRSTARRLDAFEAQILEPALRSYEQTRAGYEAGKLAFVDLLDAQRTLARAELTHLSLERAVALAVTDILAALGPGRALLEEPPAPGETP
ncbi:MAG: TolC family protein [Phycisphaerales bacterium]